MLPFMFFINTNMEASNLKQAREDFEVKKDYAAAAKKFLDAQIEDPSNPKHAYNRAVSQYYNKEYNATFIITSHYTKDIQEMCERVLVLHKGSQIYDGKFSDLIKSINPRRRLFFEFNEGFDESLLEELKAVYNFNVSNNILTAELSENDLKALLIKLLDKFSPNSMSFEDLPVEETMRSFFINPDQYLK